MKRRKRTITIYLISIIFIISLFSFFKFGGNFIINKTEKEEYIDEIKNSPELPGRFYEIYNVIYSNALETNSWTFLFNREFSEIHSHCPCREVTFTAWYPLHAGFAMILLTNLTENYTSQKECLNYHADKYHFLHNITGIQNEARYLFGKELEKLNDEELIEIILEMDNPAFYNKKRYPDKMQAQINLVLTQLKTKDERD
jgi:hypothetical protein